MARRIYNKGLTYGVAFGESEVSSFRSRWPASGLEGLRNVFAEFDKRNGDLVDLQCNRRDCHRFDGGALLALVDDMQSYGKKKLKIG